MNGFGPFSFESRRDLMLKRKKSNAFYSAWMICVTDFGQIVFMRTNQVEICIRSSTDIVRVANDFIFKCHRFTEEAFGESEYVEYFWNSHFCKMVGIFRVA